MKFAILVHVTGRKPGCGYADVRELNVTPQHVTMPCGDVVSREALVQVLGEMDRQAAGEYQQSLAATAAALNRGGE